jgi:16S rRNA G527 N7-methylase RsmG
LQNNSFEEFTVDNILEKFGGRERFSGYAEFLLEENTRVNLVSRETTPEDLLWLMADCLIPVYMSGPDELFPKRNWTRILDIGSGGGLPALPLALALGNVELTLIERTGKKAMFLRRALQKFGVKGRVLNCNFREFADNPAILTVTGEVPTDPGAANARPTFDIATIRWVKADSAMVRKTANFLTGKSEHSGLIYYSEVPGPQNIVSNTLSLSTYTYRLTGGSRNSEKSERAPQNHTLSIFRQK